MGFCNTLAVIPQGSTYLNYHAIAENTGLCRNLVQLGLTEILNEMFRLLSKNQEVVVIFSKFCRVSMQKGCLNVKFHKTFMELLSKSQSLTGDGVLSLKVSVLLYSWTCSNTIFRISNRIKLQSPSSFQMTRKISLHYNL